MSPSSPSVPAREDIPGAPGSSPAETTAETPNPRSSRLFTNRNLFGIGLAIFLIAFPFWRLPLATWHFTVGFGLVLAGMALRGWSIRQIGGSARKTSKLKAVRIIYWGPYSLVRNPIYIANAAMFAGFTVVAGFAWLLPAILIGLWLWYDSVVRREERFLEATFPDDYREYRRTTGRWIPRLRFRRRPAEIPPYPILRILRRERGGLLAVAAASLGAVVARVYVL